MIYNSCDEIRFNKIIEGMKLVKDGCGGEESAYHCIENCPFSDNCITNPPYYWNLENKNKG